MPARLTVLVSSLAAVLLLALPSTAAAARIPVNKLLIAQSGSAQAMVISLDEVPLGWGSSARQAIHAAEQSPTLQALHRRLHPLRAFPYVWRSQHPYWYIVFLYRGKIAADANVSRSGKLTGVWTGRAAWAPYTHGGLSSWQTSWLILVPGALVFMLAFFDPRRLWRLAHLDALAVLAFLASFLLLAHQHLEPAVWSAYPPLIYLLARLLSLGHRRGRPSGRLAPLLSLRTLLIGLPVLLVVRIVLSQLGHQEIDVGYESVIGAFRVLHHLPIYYNDPNHGDTYGPITYLAYIPFELLFPWRNTLSNLHAADAAAIFFDLGTVLGLILLGRRLRPGSVGTRLGLVLAWAWASCPFTTIGLIEHTNDGLLAMLTVFALVAVCSPAVSGVLLGLAAAAKFSPAGLLPLLMAPRQRGWKRALLCAGAFAGVVLMAILVWLPPGGLRYFWQRTIEFQMTRLDVFAPWSLHPSLHPLQVALEVLAVLLAGAVAFWPRERSLLQICALAGAVTVAVQLPATHWYYYYILWFLPFALVATLAGQGSAGGADPGPDRSRTAATESHVTEPVLAGA